MAGSPSSGRWRRTSTAPTSSTASRDLRKTDPPSIGGFARPRTPPDNAEIEAFFSTVKCERLYLLATYDSPIQLMEDVDAFVAYYNEKRLRQGIKFVTPAERHDGRWVAIVEARIRR